jgi:hypothetical protein
MGEQDGEVDPDHLIDAQDFYDQVLAASEGSRIGEMVNIQTTTRPPKHKRQRLRLSTLMTFFVNNTGQQFIQQK